MLGKVVSTRVLNRQLSSNNNMLGRYKDPGVMMVAEQIRRFDKKLVPINRVPWVRRCVIDPRTSAWIGWWDGIMSLALVFTGIVTPVEVGFMAVPDHRWIDPLFLINRFVDIVFLCDLGLQFVLMYPQPTGDSAGGGTAPWVDDVRLIARHYAFSAWFLLDFFSISVSAFDIFAPEDSGASRFKALRALRVLRMLKLLRLARGSRIFKRWEMRLSINYAVLSIITICFMLAFVCHLFACVWGLQASFDPLGTWLGETGYCVAWDPEAEACPPGYRCDVEERWQCVGAGRQYLYALYWSIATVTSIGYGDVVATPLHIPEQATAVVMMLFGSLLFAYLVGSFCGLAANLSPEVVKFRQDLTDLNKFLAANHIPSTLRYQLREYLHQTVYLRRNATGNRLLSEMAPKLRNEVALTINEKSLLKIDLLSLACEPGVILELAFALALGIYPPGESCPIGYIYIVSRGAALFAARPYLPGSSWGEADALLTSEALRFPIPATALNYLFTYSIDGVTLRRTMSQAKYPQAAARLRRKQVQWIVRRGIVRAAQAIVEQRGATFRGRRGSCYRHQLGESTISHLVRAARAEAKQSKASGKRKSNSCGNLTLERANSNIIQRELQRQVSANEVSSQAGGIYSARIKSSLATQMASVEETSALRKVVETVDQLQKEMEEMRHTQRLEAEANRELLCSVLEEVKRSRNGGIR